MRITTASSGRMTTHALTSGAPGAAQATGNPESGISNPRARPAPAAETRTTEARRLSWGRCFIASSSSACGSVNGCAHLLECAAAADVGDGIIDIGVRRTGLLLEQSRNGHDHAALTIPALRNVVIDP